MSLRIASLAALLVLSGCAEPDTALRNLTRSGRDARYYNPATGRYEWPDEDTAPRRPRKADAIGATLREQEKPAAPDDGRNYNPQTRQFDPPR